MLGNALHKCRAQIVTAIMERFPEDTQAVMATQREWFHQAF